MAKIIKKVSRAFLIGFDVIVLIYIVFALLMQLSAFQTFLAKRLTTYMSSELKTTIHIEKLQFDFFDRLVLKEVYAEDLHGDTLIYAGQIDIGFELKRLLGRELNINRLYLEDAYFNLMIEEETRKMNLGFIIDYFSSETEDTAISGDFELSLDRIEIVNGNFKFNDYSIPAKETGFDPFRIDVQKLNLTGNNLWLVNDAVEVDELKLSLVSQEFTIKTLQGDAKVNSEIVEMRHLFLQTNDSEIHGYYAMNYKKWTDYKDFIEKVAFNARFLPSTVSMDDIAYFAPPLKGINDIPEFSGSVKGTVDDLHGKDIKISLSNHSSASLDFEIKGLPNIDETFFFFDINKLVSSKRGIERIPLPPFKENNYLKLPENFASLGQISYSGKITGYISDVVSDGNLSTAIGNLTTDLVIRNRDIIEYEGNISSREFMAGEFLGVQNTLGKISLNAKIKGKGLSKSDIDARIDGSIQSIELLGYNYQNLKIAGNFLQEKFTGNFSVDDPNLQLAFIGSIDLSEESKNFSFIANIDTLRPNLLFGLKQFDPTANFASTLTIDITARDIDSLVGQLNLLNTLYTDKNEIIELSSFEFNSTREGKQKIITLNSGLFDFDIRGEFNMLDDFKTFKKIIQTYLPALVEEEIKIEKNFDFNLRINDYSLIHSTFTPELWIGEGSNASGKYNSVAADFNFNAELFDFKYNDFGIDTFSTEIFSKGDSIEAITLIKNYTLSNKTRSRTIRILTEAANNLAVSHITSDGEGDFQGNVQLFAEIFDKNSFGFKIRDGSFTYHDSVWSVFEPNYVLVDSGNVTITDLIVKRNDQSIGIFGKISDNPNDALTLKTENFDLAILNAAAAEAGLSISGIIQGSASIKDVKNNPLFESDLSFKKLVMNSKPLGSGHIISKWNDQLKRLEVDGKLAVQDTNKIKLSGYYDAKNQDSPLNFKLDLSYLPLTTIEPLTQGVISDFQGVGSGVFTLTGKLSKPELRGKFGMAAVSLRVDYLNTTYLIQNKTSPMELIMVQFTPDQIFIPEMKIVDPEGHFGYSTVKFTHDYFSKFDLDLKVKAERLLVLNTSKDQNELFYGTAYVSGNVYMGYRNGLTSLDIDVTAENDTRFNLALSEESEVAENKFIEFVQLTDKQKEISNAEKEEDPFNMDLKMKLKTQPGAEIRLVFDEATGDIVSARGSGDLDLRYSLKKGFEIIGEYEIESGDYFFTLQSVINKRFYIERGSTIRWNGNPYLAEMNILTSYKLRSKLANILPPIDQNKTAYEKKVPIDLRLKMTGTIESPVIGFDIFLPSSSESIRSQLQTELSSESCMNQQVFSLLVLNSFTPCESVAQAPSSTTSVGKNTAYETMSNQLGNWLSNISDDVDVGFTYRPEDQSSDVYTPEQVEVALSTQLFNDRLIIDGNVGYGTQSATTSQNQNAKDVVGEFTVEYKIRPDGKLRIKAFNHVNDKSYVENDNLYIQGVGISYRHDYNNLKELYREIFRKRKNRIIPEDEGDEDSPIENKPS